MCLCEINGVAENLYSVLSEAYSEHIHASKIERFAKIDKGWIPLTVFTKCSVLDAWLGSEYVSDYSVVFLLLSFEAVTLNLPRMFQIWWVFYLNISSWNLLLTCNNIMFQTCSNWKKGSKNLIKRRKVEERRKSGGKYVEKEHCLN